MKRIIQTFIIIIGLIFFTTGCDEDFITKEPQQSLSNETAITDAESAEVAVNGMYSNLTEFEYYGRNMMLIPGLYTDNSRMRVQNAGRYLNIYRHSHTRHNEYVQEMWNRGYEIIYSANNLLENIENKEIEADNAKGQALALRALAHFDLVKTFAQPYNISDGSVTPEGNADGNGSHLGVPIMLEATTTATPSRDPVSDVYAQIISDLEEAQNLMDFTATYRMDANAAKALLSRVYMYRASGGGADSDWEQCRDYALEVINSGNYELISHEDYLASWLSDEHSEYMFYLKYLSNDYPGPDAIGSMYHPTSYGDVVATQDLLDLLPDGDIRQNLYFVDVDDERNFILPYSENKGEDKYFIGKYPGREGTIGVDNLPVIRYSEVYLNLAEAYYNLGNDGEAINYLEDLIERVNPTGNRYDYGSSLQEQIYTMRRTELAFEGHRLYDLKRRHQSIERNDITNPDVNTEIPFPDYRFVMPIPQREIEVNQNIVQNPGY